MTEEERRRWADLFQRYRFLYGGPQARLQQQALDHIRWHRLGEKKR